MMSISKIQPSFSSGELAPSLHSRVDITKYQNGLTTCKNFLIHLSGGVNRRNGTRYIANCKYTDKKVKLISFEFSRTNTYILEFGDYYCRFYKDKGQIVTTGVSAWVTSTVYDVGDLRTNSGTTYYCTTAHTSGTFATDLAAGKWYAQTGNIYEIPTPYSESDLVDLKYNQSADVLFLTHPNYPTYELARYSDTDWTLELFNYVIPPFQISNRDESHIMNVAAVYGTTTLTSNIDYFQAGHVGSYFKMYHDIDGQSVTKSISGTGTSTTISCKGVWRIRTYGTTSVSMDISVEKSYDNGTTWKNVRKWTIVSTELNISDTEDEYCLLRINVTAWTSGTITALLQSDPFSHAGVFKVTGITSAKIAAGTVVQTFASTATNSDWAESSWSTLRGFPACSTFYQDRIVFAGTATEPQTIWLSQTGNYYNFDVSDTIVDTDRISIQLTSRKINGINNLALLTNIIALTSASEWSIGAADGGAISPTNVASSMQGNRGSSSITPVQIGNRLIYIQPSNAILRDLGYDYNSNSFTGDNLSILANHLFDGYTIVDIDYQQEPDSIVWIVRSDGKILTMTYMREQEILGFSWQETDGNFESLSVITHNNKEEVWASVLRDNKRFIEVFEEPTTVNEDQWFLDSALKYDGVATNVITGLSHLEGKTVEVLGDGNVITTLNDVGNTPLVVTGGQITLPYNIEKAIIGLPFTSELVTLPIDLTLQNGTIRDKKVRISSLVLVLENTRGGVYGDPDVGVYNELISAREYLDYAMPLFSGEVMVNINSKFDTAKKFIFKQSEPLPVSILAIIPKINIGG